MLKKTKNKDEVETINSYSLSIKKEFQNENTIKSYHSELRKILTNMLNLSQVGLDVVKFRSIDLQTPKHQGGFETIKHPIYELQLPIEFRTKDSNDESGMHRDIMDDYRN